jgi:hypothetical protein
MAVPSNTIQNVGRVGVREDLDDKISELFPDETPFINMIGRSKAKNTYTEWQTDGLAAANHNNKAVQGADLDNQNRPNTKRVGTHTQIMTKVVGASTTVEATNKAGRRSELAREIMKAGRELRTDMEKRACGNYASVAATASVEGETAGALAWLETNVDNGGGTYAAGGFSAGIVSAYVAGSGRAFAETQLKAVLADAWDAGGNPKAVIMTSGKQQTAAGFAGLADQRRDTGNKRLTIVAGADIYVSDFGEVQFVPDRFCSNAAALVIDPEYWDIAVLDPLQQIDLAKTGLATRKAMYTEWALRCLNEEASGAVVDLN